MGEKAKRRINKEQPEEPYYCRKHGLKIYFKISFCRELRDCTNCEYRDTINVNKADFDKDFAG